MVLYIYFVSRVYYICLSVIIRNWRSAISAYYRITFLVARLPAFMTFFHSLDFFFLSCTKVHPDVAAAVERSLFIYIWWRTLELFLLRSLYTSFSIFVLYLLLLGLLLLLVVKVNEKDRRRRRLFFLAIIVLNNKLLCVFA
jgi:hypothetical protein